MILLSIGDVQIVLNEIQSNTEQQLGNVVDRLLDTIEASQITAYTENARPEKPPGSKYERTFTLKQSSQKIRTGSLSGEWRTDLDWAKYVLGKQSEQAPIHRNRWKPIEQVEQEVEQIAPNIIKEEFAE